MTDDCPKFARVECGTLARALVTRFLDALDAAMVKQMRRKAGA